MTMGDLGRTGNSVGILTANIGTLGSAFSRLALPILGATTAMGFFNNTIGAAIGNSGAVANGMNRLQDAIERLTEPVQLWIADGLNRLGDWISDNEPMIRSFFQMISDEASEAGAGLFGEDGVFRQIWEGATRPRDVGTTRYLPEGYFGDGGGVVGGSSFGENFSRNVESLIQSPFRAGLNLTAGIGEASEQGRETWSWLPSWMLDAMFLPPDVARRMQEPVSDEALNIGIGEYGRHLWESLINLDLFHDSGMRTLPEIQRDLDRRDGGGGSPTINNTINMTHELSSEQRRRLGEDIGMNAGTQSRVNGGL